MFISSTPISSGLWCSSTVDNQSLKILMSLSVLHWHSSSLLYRFVVCFLVCHVCLRVTMTSSTLGKITGYLPRALIWIGHFFVYHIYKKVRFTYKYVINIDYYMAFLIAYHLSVPGDDIWTRADKEYDIKTKWRVKICLSYTSTEEITDLYKNVLSFLAKIKQI